MGTNTLKTILLNTVILFTLASSCNKEGSRPCLNGIRYSFTVTSEFSPQKEVYNLGDTIFLNSMFIKNLLDLQTNQQVDYSNSTGIGGDVGLAFPNAISMQNNPAKDSFEYVSIIGSFKPRTINQNQGINITFIENGNYQFRGGIICKKRGVYAISVDNLLSNGLNNKNCTNASFKMIVSNSDKHISLYQNILNVILDTESLNKIYCFKVQ